MAESNARYRREWHPDPNYDNDSLTKIYNLVEENSDVLDVGCSIGQLGSILRAQKGCRVTGIDIDPDSVGEAQKVLDSALVSDICAHPMNTLFAERKFQYICFADVLEHLTNPVQVLQDAKKILADEGSILISIPNVAHASVRLSLLEGRFDYTKEGLLDRTHCFFYTRQSLMEMLHKADLVPVVLDRTILGAKESDIPVSERGIISKKLIETVEKEDEALTYQFIVRAVPSNSPILQGELAKSFAQLNLKLNSLNSEIAAARGILGIAPKEPITADALNLRERLEAFEAHLSGQKADLLRRQHDYEARIQGLERDLLQRMQGIESEVFGAANSTETPLKTRISRCETMITRIWELLPIRLWRRLRNLN